MAPVKEAKCCYQLKVCTVCSPLTLQTYKSWLDEQAFGQTTTCTHCGAELMLFQEIEPTSLAEQKILAKTSKCVKICKSCSDPRPLYSWWPLGIGAYHLVKCREHHLSFTVFKEAQAVLHDNSHEATKPLTANEKSDIPDVAAKLKQTVKKRKRPDTGRGEPECDRTPLGKNCKLTGLWPQFEDDDAGRQKRYDYYAFQVREILKHLGRGLGLESIPIPVLLPRIPTTDDPPRRPSSNVPELQPQGRAAEQSAVGGRDSEELWRNRVHFVLEEGTVSLQGESATFYKVNPPASGRLGDPKNGITSCRQTPEVQETSSVESAQSDKRADDQNEKNSSPSGRSSNIQAHVTEGSHTRRCDCATLLCFHISGARRGERELPNDPRR